MKRLLPLVALALLFGGCGLNSFGLPTVKVNVKSSNLEATSTTTTGTTVVVSYRRVAVIEFRTLPGSPSGTVSYFTTQNGDIFPAGVYLPDCPTTSTTECGPATAQVSFDVPNKADENKVILLSYRLVGNNGSSQDVQLEGNGLAIN